MLINLCVRDRRRHKPVAGRVTALLAESLNEDNSCLQDQQSPKRPVMSGCSKHHPWMSPEASTVE